MFVHFIYSFFSYFTNTNSYSISKSVDYLGLNITPNKWNWGPASRDHFTYHQSKTSFWFKNDSTYGGAMLFIHLTFFLFLFFIYLKWVIFIRRIYTTHDVSYNTITYLISSLKQFFYCFLLFYLFVVVSFLNQFFRFPTELLWFKYSSSWLSIFFNIVYSYPYFLLFNVI
jgi:hypothetical protein